MNAQCSGNLAQIVVMLGRMERLKERTRESVSEGEIVCGGGGGRGKGERGREGGRVKTKIRMSLPDKVNWPPQTNIEAYGLSSQALNM